MFRRDLIKYITVITGAKLAGLDIFLSGCRNTATQMDQFDPSTIALLDEIGETILPRTKTPGAKDVAIGKFMQTIVTDCYTKPEQQVFFSGVKELLKTCQKEYGSSFMDMTAASRKECILHFDKQAKQHAIRKQQYDEKIQAQTKGTLQFGMDEMETHWFTMVKQLTLWGYFTSEKGATIALRYLPVPGRFDGDVAYQKGDRAILPAY